MPLLVSQQRQKPSHFSLESFPTRPARLWASDKFNWRLLWIDSLCLFSFGWSLFISTLLPQASEAVPLDHSGHRRRTTPKSIISSPNAWRTLQRHLPVIPSSCHRSFQLTSRTKLIFSALQLASPLFSAIQPVIWAGNVNSPPPGFPLN